MKRLVFLFCFVLISCAKRLGPSVEANPVPSFKIQYAKQDVLPWENAKLFNDGGANYNYALWSNFLYAEIDRHRSDFENPPNDVTDFCPSYFSLLYPDRLNFWAQLMVQIAKFESGFSPIVRYPEPGRIDAVTGGQLYSEGLFQMSYQDSSMDPNCAFDWQRDKNLPAFDIQKTTMDPYLNISCAVAVMAKQVFRFQQIKLGSSAYWAVIKTSLPSNRIARIQNYLSNLSYCQ